MNAVIVILLVLFLVYLAAIAPRMIRRPDYSILYGCKYAHRGLHDNRSEAPENSLAAFKKAVDGGYGIELDVQLSKDRIPVVFHDESLKRVCKAEGKVRDYTFEELQQFRLFDSEEKIPLLADFLKLVDGKVPLIIEIKIHENPETVCSVADELIAEYKGKYCIESFDPRAVMWYKKNRPEVIRGQLSADFRNADKKETPEQFLVHHLLGNFICRPDFIAYDHKHKKNLSRRLCRSLFKCLSVAWTIRSQKELDANKEDFDLFIFEGFIPID